VPDDERGSSDASHSTAAATSPTAPTRPSGMTAPSRSARSASVSPGRSDMSVSVAPGLTALMRIPSAMWSRAAVRVNALTAAFDAAYAAIPGRRPCAPMFEAMLTITPPPPVRICAISCFMDSQVPVRLVCTTEVNPSSSRSAAGAGEPRIPALLNATSSPP
jgi:hypothetical protein